jgi:hypothetical protein
LTGEFTLRKLEVEEGEGFDAICRSFRCFDLASSVEECLDEGTLLFLSPPSFNEEWLGE